MARLNFVQAEHIPPIGNVDGKRVGGALLLAWSLGNILVWSLLGLATSFQAETLQYLDKYLLIVVVFGESGGHSHGDFPSLMMTRHAERELRIHPPDEFYLPFRDPTIEPSDLALRFVIWISTTYTPISDSEALTVSQLAERTDLYETIDES